MKLLLDFFPLLLFFAAFKVWDIYIATAVAIAANVVLIGWVMASGRRVEPMQWLGLALIVVFGGATIILHNPTFIKWKPTILYWAFAVVLAFGQLVLRKNLVKAAIGKQLELPEQAWRVMAWSWTGFFTVMGGLNLWVAYNFSESTWATFKVFGIFALVIVFGLGQALFMGRYMKDDEKAGQP